MFLVGSPVVQKWCHTRAGLCVTRYSREEEGKPLHVTVADNTFEHARDALSNASWVRNVRTQADQKAFIQRAVRASSLRQALTTRESGAEVVSSSATAE